MQSLRAVVIYWVLFLFIIFSYIATSATFCQIMVVQCIHLQYLRNKPPSSFKSTAELLKETNPCIRSIILGWKRWLLTWAKDRHSRCLLLLKWTAGLGHLGILSCMKVWGKKKKQASLKVGLPKVWPKLTSCKVQFDLPDGSSYNKIINIRISWITLLLYTFITVLFFWEVLDF